MTYDPTLQAQCPNFVKDNFTQEVTQYWIDPTCPLTLQVQLPNFAKD